MVTYIGLNNFTTKGAENIHQTVKRSEAIHELARKFNVTVKQIYWTAGQYDTVSICEAPDEASLMAFGIACTASGNFRTQSLRAFTSDEMNEIFSRMEKKPEETLDETVSGTSR